MKTEDVTKWVEALRSGKYQQGKRALNKDNKFCCLGVAFDVLDGSWMRHKSGPDTWGVAWDNLHTYMSTLPLPTLAELGFSIKQHDKLIKMNDKEGKSFEEIADYILDEHANGKL